MVKLPILIYHRVLEDISVVSAAHERVYVLPVELFERQMRTLVEKGFSTPTFDDLPGLLKNTSDGKGPLVMLTFDDGTEDHYSTVYPILKRLGLKGVFYVVSGRVGQPGYVTWEQLREMSAGGMDIESHSHTHPFLTEMSAGGMDRELSLSKSVIEEHLGKPVISLGVPGGFYNRDTLILSEKAGYRYVGTSRWGINRLTPEARVLRRITIKSDGGAGLFRAALNGQAWYIWARRMVRVPLSIPKRILGPTVYAALRRKILSLTQRNS